MNDVKHMFRNTFTNLGGKLRLDKGGDFLTLPSYAEDLYISYKNDRDVYSEVFKKMSTICVQNYSITDDKKMKKNSWESLLNLLTESEKKLSEDTLIKDVMDNSLKAIDEMSHATKEFERILSSNVIKHFHELSEDNTLSYTKKSFTSLSKEMRASTEKVQNLQDQINSPSYEPQQNKKTTEISGTSLAENKLVSAQMLEENTEKEWENKKDMYLTKLFVTEAEKFKTAEKYLELFEDYLHYYSECQRILSKFIPHIRNSLDKSRHMYAFHAPLEEHLLATNRKLSYVLETCIQELDNDETLQHEGLFRISGCKSKMELFKSALNVMRIDDFVTKGFDSAVYAGALKQYLRELPIPLMTFDLYDKWCEIGTKIRQNEIEGTMEMMKSCLSQMPNCYYDNLAYLMQFLKKITDNESVNKMSASNLGLMLGPNLIRSNQGSVADDSDASVIMMLGSTGGSVLEFMIAHYTELFPDAPVYATVMKKSIKVPETLSKTLSDCSVLVDSPCTEMMKKSITTSIENDQDKSPKTILHTADSDSISSTELVTNDVVLMAGAESNDSEKNDQPLKSPRELSIDYSMLRKVPAPPQKKPYVIDNDRDKVKEVNNTRLESCPPARKRMSKLDKQVSEPMKEHDTSVTDGPAGLATSVQAVQRPNHLPPVPVKKPLSMSPSLVKPTRPENPPPRRPNNPPPPIPPFSKLKENLDQKHVEIEKGSVELSTPDEMSSL